MFFSWIEIKSQSSPAQSSFVRRDFLGGLVLFIGLLDCYTYVLIGGKVSEKLAASVFRFDRTRVQ